MSFIIIGRDTCSFCKASIDLLKLKNKPYEFIDIKTVNKNSNLWSKKPASHITVPVIFYNNEFIGGYDKLCEMLHRI